MTSRRLAVASFVVFARTREAGSIGGYITRKLVQIAEQSLAGQFK